MSNKKLPVVKLDNNGRYSVQIADGTRLIWWSVQEHGKERWFIKLSAPRDADIIGVHEGFEAIIPTRH